MTSEFLLPTRMRINDLRAALKLQFPLEDDGVASIQRDYQDSFDWRMYQKGYEYFCERHDGQVVLQLTGSRPAETPRVLFQPIPAVFADEVQSPSFRHKLASMLGIRALMTRLSLTLKRYTLRYVDRQGKTRLFIYIEDYRLPLGANKSRNPGKRVRLESVKGYSRPAALLGKYLSQDLQLQAAEDSIADRAYKMVGVVPGDYSSRLDVQLDAGMRTDLALKQILLFSLDIMEINEAGTIKDIDSEFLHDFRVAVRRSRSVLSQIREVFPQAVVRRYAAQLKWLGSITGPTRDMHVYLLKFPHYRAGLPEAMRPNLDALHDFLQKHLQMEHAILVKALKSQRYVSFKKNWRVFLQAEPPQRTRLANAAVPIRHTADAHIWKAFRKIIRQGGAITEKCPDEKLHKLRITCKKLRYLLEFFQSLYAERKLKPLIRRLKQLQDILGDFQDLSVQVDSLNGMQQQMREENMMTENTHQAMDHLARQFHQQKSGLRQKFVEHFALFSDKNSSDLYRGLFKPLKVKT